MPTYYVLDSQFKEAQRSKSIQQFIRNLQKLEAEKTNLYIVCLFLARAYDFVGQVDKSADYYIKTIQLARANDKNTINMVREVYAFIDKTGRQDISKIIVSKQLPGAKTPTPKILNNLYNNSPEQAFNDGKLAFNNNDLNKALELLEYAYNAKFRTAQSIYILAQTLQRLHRFGDANFYLDEGIKLYKQNRDDLILFINLKAQIYSSQQQWNDAIKAYEELLKLQSKERGGQRRFTFIQLINIYRRISQPQQVERLLNRLLKEFPQDPQALRIQSSLQSSTQKPVMDEVTDEDSIQIDLPDEKSDPVSPMLQRDIEVSQYRDEIIIRNGKPTVNDAERLLAEAEATKESDFVERYPLFLEAAKAFNDLPEFTFEISKLYRALARYAMLKGGALVSQFDRELNSLNLHELRRLRDSAISYYQEALVLQANIDSSYLLIALANHLYIQIAFVYKERIGNIPNELVSIKQDFSKILWFSERTNELIIREILYNSIVSWGSSMGNVWNQMNAFNVIGAILNPSQRKIPYNIFSQMVNKPFKTEEKVGNVLSQVFQHRRNQTQEAYTFFSRFNHPLKIEIFKQVKDAWDNYQQFQDVLLDTDLETVSRMTRVLATLAPYQQRNTDERTSILVSSRNDIEMILDFIEQNTTYWGRVSFEPILNRWLDSIRSIEQRRSSEVKPILQVNIGSQFKLEHDDVVGSLTIDNIGRGTAEKFTLRYVISDNDQNELHDDTQELEIEIPSNEKYFYQIIFPNTVLAHGISQSYLLSVKIIPFYRGVQLDADWIDYTLEIGTAIDFTLDDIIWDELRIPQDPKMFVGRDEFISMLEAHLKSRNRARTYILVGLTRTGKSSILKYLSRKINLEEINVQGKHYKLICFMWDLAKASAHANATDMWEYLLYAQIVSELEKLAQKGYIPDIAVPQITNSKVRLKDWDNIIGHLHQHDIFPVFLIDEFSHYKNLVDKQRVDSSFLSKIREDALSDRASFIFAGTYDLRKLMKDSAYGITGQLVNATQKAVSSVSELASFQLMDAMGDKLIFTEDAKDLLLRLSGRIPYFIQLLCKRCAEYAYYQQRRYIGPAELDYVVKVLTGEAEDDNVQQLDSSIFMNNMLMVGDPIDFDAVLTTICHLVRGQQSPRYVTYSELMQIWHTNGIPNFKSRLSTALNELTEREVLQQKDDEGQPAYRMNVDLFRRWWSHERPYLNMELDRIKEDSL